MEAGLVAPSFPALWPALWEVPLLGRTDHQAGTGRNAVVLSSLGELTAGSHGVITNGCEHISKR